MRRNRQAPHTLILLTFTAIIVIFIYFGTSKLIATDNELTQLKIELRETQNQIEKINKKLSSRYIITDEERRYIEEVVTSETRGEDLKGSALVAQCIRNACEIDDLRPIEAIKKFKYAEPAGFTTPSVEKAVSLVFDDGTEFTEEPILYFYAPDIVYSSWHETQDLVLEYGCHRFFARNST